MQADDYPHPHQIDFLTIGHICYDITPGGRVVGGAAAYASSVAQTLGCRTAVVTSAAPEDDWQKVFPGIAVHQKPSAATTIFENVYTASTRTQTIHAVAEHITVDDVPVEWSRPAIVHLAPIANEVELDITQVFSTSVLGLGAQGWMRRWDDSGRVFHIAWDAAATVVPLAAVTFISVEDLIEPDELDIYRGLARTLVVTDGRRGCRVYFNGEARQFPAPVVPVVNTTGAGDIFAGAYLVRLYQTDGDVWEAARYANEIAGQSVTTDGLATKMQAIRQWLERSA